jgi:hypothetical protein
MTALNRKRGRHAGTGTSHETIPPQNEVSGGPQTPLQIGETGWRNGRLVVTGGPGQLAPDHQQGDIVQRRLTADELSHHRRTDRVGKICCDRPA